MMSPTKSFVGRSILITGGAGFIGSHLARRLLAEGAQVVVADDFSSGKRENLSLNPNLVPVEVELTSPGALDVLTRTCAGVDSLVHLAANASVSESIKNPGKTHLVNAAMSLNLFEWAGKTKLARVVFASSAAVYGEPTRLPLSELDLPRPLSPYGVDKLASEGYLACFAHMYGYLPFPLRFMNVYGRGQSAAYAGVLTKFLESLSRGENPTVFGDGTQTRDFVHVEDIVEAIVAALASETAPAMPMNIGTGKPTSLNEVLDVLRHWSDFEPVYLDFREGEIHHSYADVSEARRFLGWEARVSLKDGLATLMATSKPDLLKLSQQDPVR